MKAFIRRHKLLVFAGVLSLVGLGIVRAATSRPSLELMVAEVAERLEEELGLSLNVGTMAVAPAKGIGTDVRTHSQLTITPAPQGGSRISLQEAQTGLLARNALGMWLDDLMGDMLDTQEHSACGKTTPCRSLTAWMARKHSARDNNAKA